MKKLFLNDLSFLMAIAKEIEGIESIELYMDDGSKLMTVQDEMIILTEMSIYVNWLSIRVAHDVQTNFNAYYTKLTSNDSTY